VEEDDLQQGWQSLREHDGHGAEKDGQTEIGQGNRDNRLLAVYDRGLVPQSHLVKDA
jgi:hypothetical protein